MGEFSAYFEKLFQLNSGLGLVLLFILVPLVGIAAYRLTYSKKIDTNGKVILTRKVNLDLQRFVPTSKKPVKKRKPFTRLQRRLLSILYAAHEALFGLVIFVFGLGLVTQAFIYLSNDAHSISDPIVLTCILLGVLAMPVGVLLIYFRNAENPFD